MAAKYENTLAIWEQKILGKISGPVKENAVWKIRNNQEFIDVYREPDITLDIRKGRSRWIGDVKIMSEERTGVYEQLRIQTPGN